MDEMRKFVAPNPFLAATFPSVLTHLYGEESCFPPSNMELKSLFFLVACKLKSWRR